MKLALFQTEPQTQGLSVALRNLDNAARQAAGHAADLLITPEMYLTGYAIGAEGVRAAALTLDGPSMQEVSEIAQRWSVGLLVGFPERDGEKIYNSVCLFDRTGASVLVYRKTHMWGEIDRAQFSRGEALSDVVEFLGWKVSLAICYDIEFPEVARAAAVAGVDVIFVPTAAMKPHVTVATQMIPTRAEENEIFVAYANYIGSEGETHYFGHSTIAGPDGEVIASAGEEDTLVIAELDQAACRARRIAIRHVNDMRSDLYGTES